MRRLHTLAALLLLCCTAAHADGAFYTIQQFFDKPVFRHVSYDMRIGYSIGGTAPLPMPSTIRDLNKFELCTNVCFGFNAHKHFNKAWGLSLGLYLESKDMSEDALTKNYAMEITQGGETLAGRFTGDVYTKEEAWMITLPVQAAYTLHNDRWTFRAGAYASIVTSHQFYGYAHNGYLRRGDPTGTKVVLGEGEGQRGTYDFSEHMRRMQYGVQAGVDFRMFPRWIATADIKWGLTGIFHSDFKTIEQTLYPIFGTIGIAYKFKRHKKGEKEE